MKRKIELTSYTLLSLCVIAFIFTNYAILAAEFISITTYGILCYMDKTEADEVAKED